MKKIYTRAGLPDNNPDFWGSGPTLDSGWLASNAERSPPRVLLTFNNKEAVNLAGRCANRRNRFKSSQE